MATLIPRVSAEVRVQGELVRNRCWAFLDVMRLGQVRGWTRRQFNLAMRGAARDAVVTARWQGQLDLPPYTSYGGGLSGVNGKLVREDF